MSSMPEHDRSTYYTRSQASRPPTPEPGLFRIDVIEKAFTQALRDFFPIRNKNPDPRTDFYAHYQKEAEEYDREFIKKYDEDLNTTLIFAGLFSGVTSGFIIDAQTNLEEDHSETSATLLLMLLQKLDNPSFVPDFDSVAWNGPPAVIVHVLSVLYCSLAASLLAAFVAMLGKQWLNRYERVANRGSLIERSRDRQVKTDGMAKWHFHFVMECLSLILQAAVLLLGYALSQYLWTIDHTVASVIIGFTVAGLIFYSLVVTAGIMSYNCPFQTPVSQILRQFIFYKEKRAWLRSKSSRLSAIFFNVWQKFHISLPQWRRAKALNDVELNSGLRGLMPGELEKELQPMFHTPALAPYRISDIRCASWLLKTSTDADVTLAAVRFVPDIERHASKATPSLGRLYEALSACFDSPDDFQSSDMRTKAYEAAKMFIQVYRQRRCVCNQNDVIEEMSSLLTTGNMPECSPDDADLYSVLGMVQEIFKDARSEVGLISTLPPGISFRHLSWILHILLYRIWEFQRDGVAFPEFIYEFLRNSFSLPMVMKTAPEHLERFFADYLLAVALTIGLPLDAQDLLVDDKSEQMDLIVTRLYEQLNFGFTNFIPGQDSDKDSNNLLAALTMLNVGRVADRMAKWSHHALSYDRVSSPGFVSPEEKLLIAIMQSRIPEPDRWQAARLSLQLVFRNRPFYPSFKDSSFLVGFLDYHFSLEEQGEFHAERVADAFEALSSPFLHPPTSLDITQGLYLTYMQKSLWPDRPIRLRRNALFYIDWLGYRYLDAAGEALEPYARSEFCENLASICPEDKRDHRHLLPYFEVLLRMANSRIWRPHLLLEQWYTLEFLSTKYKQSTLLEQCIHNEMLVPSLAELPEGEEITKLWLKIVWRQPFENLPPTVVILIRKATFDLFCREGEPAMLEFEELINPDHHAIGLVLAADPERRMGIRRRESIFQELCDEVEHFLHEEPRLVASPARMDSFMSDETDVTTYS